MPVSYLDGRSELCIYVQRSGEWPRLERVHLRVSREGGRAVVCRQTDCLRLDLDPHLVAV